MGYRYGMRRYSQGLYSRWPDHWQAKVCVNDVWASTALSTQVWTPTVKTASAWTKV